MRIRFVGELPFGVTAKDMVLGAIGQIGVAGGVGHVIEYAGPAIEALSMEGRMTICNMSIEGGARAGMIAPDDTTFAYLEGRPGRAEGRRLGARRSTSGARCAPTTGAIFDREVEIDVAALVAAGHVGHEPGHGRADRRRASPTRRRYDDPAEREAVERALDYMGLEPGTPLARDPHRPRLHRLVHELAHRGSARRGRGRRRARRSRRRVRAMVVPGSAKVKRQAEEEGLDRVFTARRLRVARGRLLDVPRHEPRHPRRRRALRLDLEPQLRGPPGRRRRARTSLSPTMAAAAAITGHFIDVRELLPA